MKPKDHSNSYINRKGFPSVVLQGVCDNKKLFTDVFCGLPGSVHDATVFKKSDLYERIRSGEVQFPENSHLLGDLAYPLSTTLITGYKENRILTLRQRNFNIKLSEVRVLIENAFGLLKGRFRRLKFMETVRLDLICLLIVTACILHNICILKCDILHDYDEEINIDFNDVDQRADIEPVRQEAINKQNQLANLY